MLLFDELVQYIFSLTDLSTNLSCRLTSKRYSQLPCKKNGELLIHQALIDGNEDLFFLAVEQQQPPVVLFQIAVKHKMFRVLDYLIEEVVTTKSSILDEAIEEDLEEVFARYMYSAYSCNCSYSRRSWTPKYLKKPDFTKAENQTRLYFAYKDGDIDLIKKLEGKGYKLAYHQYADSMHPKTAIWLRQRGDIPPLYTVFERDYVDYFIETGESPADYIQDIFSHRNVACFNLILQRMGVEERISTDSPASEFVRLILKHNIKIDKNRLYSLCLKNTDIDSLKLLEFMQGRKISFCRRTNLTIEEINWLYERHPKEVIKSIGILLIKNCKVMFEWCKSMNVPIPNDCAFYMLKYEELKFLHDQGVNLSEVSVQDCLDNDAMELIHRLTIKPVVINKFGGYYASCSKRVLRWFYRKGLVGTDFIRKECKHHHPSLFRWITADSRSHGDTVV